MGKVFHTSHLELIHPTSLKLPKWGPRDLYFLPPGPFKELAVASISSSGNTAKGYWATHHLFFTLGVERLSRKCGPASLLGTARRTAEWSSSWWALVWMLCGNVLHCGFYEGNQPCGRFPRRVGFVSHPRPVNTQIQSSDGSKTRCLPKWEGWHPSADCRGP